MLLDRDKLEAQLSSTTKKASRIVPLMIKDAKIHAVVAETDEECAEGLGHIRKLEHGTGMLFTKASGCFWMKNVHVPLDLMYLDKSGEVFDIHHMPVEQDPAHPTKLYRSVDQDRTAMALEVPSGWCTNNKIAVGDIVVVKS
jgi:uncharacterized membrane protein (UPF0127 family)